MVGWCCSSGTFAFLRFVVLDVGFVFRLQYFQLYNPAAAKSRGRRRMFSLNVRRRQGFLEAFAEMEFGVQIGYNNCERKGLEAELGKRALMQA